VICPPGARAADTQAPRDQHCTDPKCMCGHRTDRYREPQPKVRIEGEHGPELVQLPHGTTVHHPHTAED
jgi:hypothetical protein